MLDCQNAVAALFAAAQAAPTQAAAERVITPILANLRDWIQIQRIQADAPVMLRTWSPPEMSATTGIQAAAGRLEIRLNEIELARRFGDAADVQRMIDLTLRELRQAALAAPAA